MSIGYPGKSFAFCGAWHTLSKLLLIVVSLQGRHRGLASSLESSVALSKHMDREWSRHDSKEKDWHVNVEEKPGCGV